MLFSTTTLTIIFSVLFAQHAHSAVVDLGNINIFPRQVECSAYGEFEPFTGPCEKTNCGAKGRNCIAEGFDGCVGFPNLKCPLKGCSCTNF